MICCFDTLRHALLGFLATFAFAGQFGCGRSGSDRAGPTAPDAASRGILAGAPKGTAMMGKWFPLPPHGGGRVRHVNVALGPSGAFLAMTLEGEDPRVFHGRWVGAGIEWSPPWLVPLPPPKPHVEHWMTSWDRVGDSLLGLYVAIDRDDPMRIAVNRLEYQGGSYGLVVGRWGQPFLEVPYPDGESDIPFGVPIVLRGPELFTHELSIFWHFRLTDRDFKVKMQPLEVEELLGLSAVDKEARTVVLSAPPEILVLKRGGAGDFALHRRVTTTNTVANLGLRPDGQATVLLDNGDAYTICTYDTEWREMGRWHLSAAELDENAPGEHRMVSATAMVDGARVIVETKMGNLSVVDVPTHRHVRLEAVPSYLANVESVAMHGDHVVLVSTERIGLYSLTGAF